MKIGILTVPFNNNYGGFLQAYALKYVLVSMGHEVYFIDRRRNIKGNYFCYVLKHFLHLDKRYRKQIKISYKTNIFRSKYLSPETETYYTTKKMKRCKNYCFDCYIVGSDQVWRYHYAKENIEDYFLSFVTDDHIPKISYAASFGIFPSYYDEDKINNVRFLINKFKAISVRETSGKLILNKEFGVPLDVIKVVLDPTMLLDVSIYVQLMNEEKRIAGNYIFTYILDQTIEIDSFILRIRNSKQTNVVSLRAQTGDYKSWNTLASVECWLNRIYYSKYVITDSFHGMIFSIIFNKPFYVICNNNRGKERFVSILQSLDLLDVLITDMKSSLKDDFLYFDWNTINKKIESLKLYSLEFLSNAIEL